MSVAIERLKQWRENPVQFVRQCLGIEPDDWQIEILCAFAKNQRLAMKAAKGPGKTAVLSWLCWNFLVTRPYPKIAATSISWDNLADGLWTEMAKTQSKSELLKTEFQWTKTRIVYKKQPEQWWMSARTWAKGANSSQQADTLAGLHADYLLFVIDEAGGVPDSVMAAAEAGLSTGIETKIVIAGNPTHLEGPLYRAATSERHLWYLVNITGDPNNPKRSKRISIQWAKDQISKYGETNPWVVVNVFGEFPPSSMNALLGPDEIERAMNKHLREDQYDFAQKRIGVDVSRFGDDRTILFPRQGLASFTPVEMRNARTNEIAARLAQAKVKWGSEIELIDDTGGWGAGVVDSMIQAGYSPMPINFSGKALDNRYFNKRSEMWFMMAEWVKRGGALPNIPELARELSVPTYTFHNGKLRLEEKEMIKERLGFSPDMADALALTFALPEMPRRIDIGPGANTGKLNSEYDPYDDSRLSN